jgi:D-glycero-D-manno-heptose 1,7-bisphosphate phosphatase
MVPPRAAVFLDRDGVINTNVRYADTGEWEAPRSAVDFKLLPRAIEAMGRLGAAGYLLFIVSNQPNLAKQKATRTDHDAIHARLMAELSKGGAEISEAYYCFHHPEGIERSLRGPCDCRKPSPHFLFVARDAHRLDLGASWMIGDRETDIICGRRAGVRTVRIAPQPLAAPPACVADHDTCDLWQAAKIILRA